MALPDEERSHLLASVESCVLVAKEGDTACQSMPATKLADRNFSNQREATWLA